MKRKLLLSVFFTCFIILLATLTVFATLPSTYGYYNFYTISGNMYTVQYEQNHLFPGQAQMLANYYYQYCPGAFDLSPATTEYNCHGYAWCESPDNTHYRLFDIDPFLNDSHTHQLTAAEVQVGDRIVYYGLDGNNGFTPLHSGVIAYVLSGNSFMVISKWGEGALYQHDYSDVPPDYYCDYNNSDLVYGFYRYDNMHSYSIFDPFDDTIHECRCGICGHMTFEEHNYVDFPDGMYCPDCGHVIQF